MPQTYAATLNTAEQIKAISLICCAIGLRNEDELFMENL